MKTRDPKTLLAKLVAEHGTQSKAADALGISAVYFSDLMNDRRDFSEVMLAKLGLERVIVERKATTA